MLSAEDLRDWYKRLGLSETSSSAIDHIRSAPPSRRVGGGRQNVSGRYPSRKMGVTIQFESHRVELAGIYEMEHDAGCLEYYDQPPPLKLAYKSANGRHLTVIHTPDFFVLRRAEAGWEEWKTEEDLVRLAEHNSHRYCLDAQGGWRCPPGEAQASPLGFYYRVRSSRQIDWTYQRNIQFLEDYLRAHSRTVDPHVQEIVLAWVSGHPGSTLSDLFRATEGLASRDDVYMLIACDAIQVDLSSAPLVDPQQVCVSANNTRPVEHPDFPCQPTIPSVEALTPVEAGHDQSFDMSPDQMAEANRRLELIRAYQAGEPLADGVSGRAVRNWMQNFRRAEALHEKGYLGLLPRSHQRGNRTPKLPGKTRALITQFIETHYKTLKQKRRLHVYGALARACESHGTPAPSYKTFCFAVRHHDPSYEQTLKRKGRRAAYGLEPPYLELELTTPRHGDRPFHICHIDHTELDIELVCSRTRQNLGRPWYTMLTDAFSRRLLAIFFTFDPPSYRSCMMVLRECVRRHGRFPQSLVVDGGKEFGSVYFDTLLARFECIKKTRPPAKARFGSVCERLFGTSNTRFIHNLAGNTQIMKNIRQVTKSVNPKRHAEWTLAELYEGLCQWAYEVYDTISHPALGQTPREAFAAGLAQSGIRPHRMIAYDEEFRLWTLPTTARGQARVVPGKGVKINHVFYWAATLRDPEVERMPVPVRYDPYDAGVAYALVRNRWIQCISEHYSALRGKSERELMLATAELRRRTQHHAGQFTVTAKKLADFLASAEGEHVLRMQRTKEREANGIVTAIQAGRGELRCDTAVESEIPAGDGVAVPLAVQATTKTLSANDLTMYEEY
jgi:transposase InsO family protein